MHPELRTIFNSQGYAIIPNFISAACCQQLIAEQQAILQNQNFQNDTKLVFDTRNQQHAQDKYFFDSARSIKLFYEKDAFNHDGTLKMPLDKAINKIGHALHDFNPVFKKFSYNPKIRNLALLLGIIQPQIVQSMYLMKQPKIGNQVDLHQDSTFIHTTPETCLGLWFALEDATKENGCLWAMPGAHTESLREKLIRNKNSTAFEILDKKPFDMEQAIPLEVKAGTLIVLHGRLPHYSEYNHSQRSRHAYSLHVVDATAEYSKTNWLQDNEVPFSVWDECSMQNADQYQVEL